MKLYTHPHPSPAHVMRSYRKALIGQKRIWMSQRKAGRRCLRGLVHYRDLIDEYLAAKRLVFKLREVIATAETQLAGNGTDRTT
jgi:hypothetical protein